MPNFARARVNMVDGQILPNRVTDPALIIALNTVPRELFVPAGAEGVAYCDEEIPVGRGRALLEPLVLARLLQGAAVTARDVVLDIGCATGYSSAVLAGIASAVVAVESDPELHARAAKNLATLAANTVTLVNAPLTGGHPSQAPYDVILINGAVAEVPEAILAQLADGGRLVTMVTCQHAIARLAQARLYRKIGTKVSSVALFEASVSSLPGFVAKPRFTL